jgi:hypothetical protein
VAVRTLVRPCGVKETAVRHPACVSIALLLAFIVVDRDAHAAPTPQKPRTIVTTDGEVDDMDSFIRFLLYTNEVDLVGLVYSSSQWHYAGDGKGTRFTSQMPSTAKRYGERTDLRWPGTQWMQGFIDRYAAVHASLMKHDRAYPSPEHLRSLVKVGNIEFEGEMAKDSEGSNLIKKVLLDDDPRPIFVQIWGGTNTLARALKSIEDEFKATASWQGIYRKVSRKTVIYAILDQDATYKAYVAPNWPEIKVIYNAAQFWSFAYQWPRVVPADLKPYLGGPWFAEHIRFNHGALLEAYYLWGDGRQIAGDPEHTQGDPEQAKRQQRAQYDFISEGDSPAYFFLLDFGLRSADVPSFGGLGGRFAKSAANPNRWEDGAAVSDLSPYTGKPETSYPQVRWIATLQNDFAARADWCVKDRAQANHAPVVGLDHPASIAARPGDTVRLSGKARDPDGNQLRYLWWQYREAGTCAGAVPITDADKARARVTVPADAKPGDTIHLILEVSDNGSPSLTRYQRVVITVR